MRSQGRLGLAVVTGLLLPLISQSAAQQAAEAVDTPVDSQMVTIDFEGVVGDEPFSCGESYQLGSENTTVTPLDFRLYISDVALPDGEDNAVPLVLEQDGLWQHQNVALLDFEDKTGGCVNGTSETRAQVVGAVPAGEYSGLRFTVGVPFALNHIDSTLAPSPLNLTALWWNWNFGYKFMRLDFNTSVETAMSSLSAQSTAQKSEIAHTGSQAFVIHLGSVGCQLDSAQAPIRCTSPNQAEIELSGFDPAQNVVFADVAALLSETNLSENQEGTAIGFMSSPTDSDCSGIMQNIGLPFPNQPLGEQTFFSTK